MQALAPSDFARPWATLAVPHHLEAPHIVRSANGFVALAREQVNSEKVVSATYHYLYRSDDAVTWHRLPFPTNDNPYISVTDPLTARGVTPSSGSMGPSRPPRIPRSGLHCRQRSMGAESMGFRRLARLQNQFFDLGVNDVTVSSDGLSWTRRDVPLVQGRAIAFGNGKFVIAGALSIRTSPDGSTWEDRSPSCATPGAACVSDPSGKAYPGPYSEHGASIRIVSTSII